MLVTFYGVRGSIATPGPATVRFGGNTVCVSVRTLDGSLLVLDAGTGIRVLGNEMLVSGVPRPIDLLVTHSHWDHIIGMPFFAPIWDRQTHLKIHTLSPWMHERMTRRVLFDGEHFPVSAKDVPADVESCPFTGRQIRVGSAVVSQISLNHPGGADGYRIDDADGSSLCYLTDNELSPPGLVVTPPADLARFAFGTGLLIHDAQYLPSDMPYKRGWGHSLVHEVLDLARMAEARTVALHHHDPSRTDEELDVIAANATAWAREHAPGLSCLVASEGLSLEIR